MSKYSPAEEKLNIISHGIGYFLSIVALILLVLRASACGGEGHIVSAGVFGVSLVLLYTASTLYHNAKEPVMRYRLKIFDHAAIYVLIAGTYTPFAIITLSGTVGWVLLFVSWALALIGITLKLFFTGRYNTVSTIMYVLMGWIIIFAINPLMDSLSQEGLHWLFAGGVSYTLGALIFSIPNIKFNHAIFHLFVLVGSFCHFWSVYFYVLPSN